MPRARIVVKAALLGLLAALSAPAAGQYAMPLRRAAADAAPRGDAPAAAPAIATAPAEVLRAAACAVGRDANPGRALLATVPRSAEERDPGRRAAAHRPALPAPAGADRDLGPVGARRGRRGALRIPVRRRRRRRAPRRWAWRRCRARPRAPTSSSPFLRRCTRWSIARCRASPISSARCWRPSRDARRRRAR